MLRKLVESDRDLVMEFLSADPSLNLFMIGDIENYGFDDPTQDVWGVFNNGLTGVLLRYRQNFIPYFLKPDNHVDQFKNIIEGFSGQRIISGKASIVEAFQSTFERQEVRKMFFCELNKKTQALKCQHDIKVAALGDAERIFNFINQIEEFSGINSTVEAIEKKLLSHTGRIYYIEDDKGEIISVSQTTAENSKSAMVVGVATRSDRRGEGLMSSCLSKLSLDLLDEQKTLCLFYDNPKAGIVYHRLGYESIENWMMLVESK